MCDDRLQRGKRVRRRDGATCRLHMQPRLCVNIRDDNRVCGQHKHMCCLRFRLQLHREWRASGILLVFGGLRVDGDDIQRLRSYIRDVRDGRLWRG